MNALELFAFSTIRSVSWGSRTTIPGTSNGCAGILKTPTTVLLRRRFLLVGVVFTPSSKTTSWFRNPKQSRWGMHLCQGTIQPNIRRPVIQRPGGTQRTYTLFIAMSSPGAGEQGMIVEQPKAAAKIASHPVLFWFPPSRTNHERQCCPLQIQRR